MKHTKDAYITVRIKKTLKKEVEKILKKNKLTHSEFINHVYEQTVETMKSKENKQ